MQPRMTKVRAEALRIEAVQDLEWAKRLNCTESIRIHRERIAKLDRIIDYYEPDSCVIVEASHA